MVRNGSSLATIVARKLRRGICSDNLKHTCVSALRQDRQDLYGS